MQSKIKHCPIPAECARQEAALTELAQLDAPEVMDLPPSTPHQTPGWQPIGTAPLDAWVLVYAAPRDGLDGFICTARYHSDGGWCVDELRHVTHWMPLPEPPHAE